MEKSLDICPSMRGATRNDKKLAEVEALYYDVISFGATEYFLQDYFDLESEKLLNEKIKFLTKLRLHKEEPDKYERPPFEEEQKVCEKYAEKLKNEKKTGVKVDIIH